jgi:hypothetical protein
MTNSSRQPLNPEALLLSEISYQGDRLSAGALLLIGIARTVEPISNESDLPRTGKSTLAEVDDRSPSTVGSTV